MDRDEAINTLLTKGVSQIFPSKEDVLDMLQSKSPLTVYCGFDPTAPTLHIGHAIQLRKLREFQDLGHKIVFLIGDFTARIGDPTDKLATRSQLTKEEVKRNFALYKKQASLFLRFSGKNKVVVRFNGSWLKKITLEDVIKLASFVTVEQMQKRDMFSRRAAEGKPTYLHEFLYPLMQGYDSVAMGIDGEIGGNDQLFNMLMGRTLLKQIKNKEKFVITLKLLEDSDGKKMGKTEGNMVALNDTPEEMYKKIMSWPDSLISVGFELCTEISLREIKKIEQGLQRDTNPRDVKMKLSFEITKSVHGEKKAMNAQEAFIKTFQKGESSELVKKIEQDQNVKETLIKEGLISSNGEFRRLVVSGAISSTVTQKKLSLQDFETTLPKGIYRIGRDRFFEIV